MRNLKQKKFSIRGEQIKFLENYKKWGFSDKSSIVREALDRYIKEVKTQYQKRLMTQKSRELLSDYLEDKELTTLTDLDSEDFL